jgi:hypothetical protein
MIELEKDSRVGESRKGGFGHFAGSQHGEGEEEAEYFHG